jgi:hypothetical protein
MPQTHASAPPFRQGFSENDHLDCGADQPITMGFVVQKNPQSTMAEYDACINIQAL